MLELDEAWKFALVLAVQEGSWRLVSGSRGHYVAPAPHRGVSASLAGNVSVVVLG